MLRVVSAGLLVVLCVFAARAQDAATQAQKPATEYKIPEEAKKQVNPVKPTAESIADGKKEYGTECAMCHGTAGDGKGDLAADMKLTLADFRDPASLKDVTDGEIFYVIKTGKGDMTGEGDRLKPNQTWNIINYVRSFAKKGEAAK